jgi:hypothetical protein
VWVADIDGEEFEEAQRGPIARSGYELPAGVVL